MDGEARRDANKNSPLFQIVRVLVRFDHVASFIVNANHKILLFTSSSLSSPCSEKPRLATSR